MGQQAAKDVTMELSDQSSGTNRSTIGHTFIPPAEREKIHDEVAAVMRQMFPGIQLSTVHTSGPGKSGAFLANMTDSRQNSAPMAIAGSEVSVASTSNDRGTRWNSRDCRNRWVLIHSPGCSRRPHGSPKSHLAFMGAALRMFIRGHP